MGEQMHVNNFSKEENMDSQEAEEIVGYAWSHNQTSHPRLQEALKALHISMSKYRELFHEARSQQRGLPRCCLLTPTGTRR